MRRALLNLAGTFTLLALAILPARADTAYSEAFVDAFAAACVPQRLSYEGSRAQAEAEGWVAVELADHPELDALMQRSLSATRDPDYPVNLLYQAYRRDIAGMPHHLLVTRVQATIAAEEDMEFIEIGCYLYNLDATEPLEPAPVSALLDRPVGQSQVDEAVTAWVWGPACSMPRTLDTYLTFIPDGSPHVDITGFSGMVLKFATSEPAPGEVVPATYC